MNYSIKFNEINDADCTVYSTSAVNPFTYLSEITSYLSSIKYEGYVIFDLLTTNGNNNRFHKIFFNGNEFVRKTQQSIIIAKTNTTRTKLNKFYSENYSTLDLSLVKNSLNFLISKGYVEKY